MMALITAISGLTQSTEAQQLHPFTVYPYDARPEVQTLIPAYLTDYSYTYDYRYLLTTSQSLTGVGVLDVQNKHAERYPLLNHLPHPPGVNDWQYFVWNNRRYVVSVGGSEVRVWDITDPLNHTVTAARISPGPDPQQFYFDRAQQVGVVINESGCYIIVGGLRPSVLLVLRFDGSSLSLVGVPTPSGKGLGVTVIASRPPNFDMIAVGTYGGVIELYTVDSSGSLTPAGVGQLAMNQGAITRLSFVPNVDPALVAMDETPRIYLWDVYNKYPLAMKEALINLTKFQPWITDRGSAFLLPRFHFTPDGKFFALRWATGSPGVDYDEYATLTLFEIVTSNTRATSLRVAGTLNGRIFKEEPSNTSYFSFALGPNNDAWIGWIMQPLHYANAPWDVSLRLPNNAGVGTAIACSPSGALIGTSQGHLYYYDAEAIGAESYTPMGGLGINGVVHSAVYLGTQGDDQYFLISYGDGNLDIIRVHISPASRGLFRHAGVASLPGWGALRLHARSDASGALIAVGGSASGTLSVWRWQTTDPAVLTEATTESTRWFTGRVISDVAWNSNNNQIGLALRRAEWGRATFTGNGFSNQTVQAGSRNGAGAAWDGNTLRVVYSLNAPSGWAGYQILYVPDTFRPNHRNRLIIDGANYAFFSYSYPIGDIFGTYSNSWRMVSSAGRPTPVVRLAHGVVYRDYPYAVATTSQGHVAFFLTPPLGLRGDYIAHQHYHFGPNTLSINRSTRHIALGNYIAFAGTYATTIYEPDSTNPLGYRITKRIRGSYMLHPVPMVINGVPETLLHSWLPRNQLEVAKLDVNASTGISPIQTISGRGFMSTSWNGNYLVSMREVSGWVDFQVHQWDPNQGRFVDRGGTFGSYYVPSVGLAPQCYVSDDGNWVAVFYRNYNVNSPRIDLDIYRFDQGQWQLVRSEQGIVPPYALITREYSPPPATPVPVYPIIPGTNRLLVQGDNSLDEYDMATGNRTTTPLQRNYLFGFGTSDNGDLLFYHLVDEYYLVPRSNRLLKAYRYDGVNWNLISTFDREARSDETLEPNNFRILRPIGGSGFVVVPSLINGIVVADSP